MANLNLAKWLLINGSVNVYYYKLEGSIEDQDVDQESLTWNTRLNVALNFKGDWRFQLTGRYRGPSVTAQGDRKGMFMSNLAIRKDLLERKLSVTLSGRDLFSSAKREGSTSGEGFYTYDKFTRESPIFTLSLSLKINNYKNKDRERSGDEGFMDSESDFEF
jgi:hypothetical protein